MAANLTQVNEDLKYKAKVQMAHAKNPVEYIQALFLSRGASGMNGLRRRFRLMDKDGSRSLTFEEFDIGMQQAGVDRKIITDERMKELFDTFDRDGQGTIDYDEFLLTLQPKMNDRRKKMVNKAFMCLDKSGDQVITVQEMARHYTVDKHPKYISGEWSATKVLKELMVTFEASEHIDGLITFEEFESYYASISCNIDNDAFFCLMMTNCWKPLQHEHS